MPHGAVIMRVSVRRCEVNICDICGGMYHDELIETQEICPSCKALAEKTERLPRGILAEITDTVEKIGLADRMVSALCKAPGIPGARTWTSSLETRETDPDHVIGEALTAAQVTIYGLLGALERMAEENHRLKQSEKNKLKEGRKT